MLLRWRRLLLLSCWWLLLLRLLLLGWRRRRRRRRWARWHVLLLLLRLLLRWHPICWRWCLLRLWSRWELLRVHWRHVTSTEEIVGQPRARCTEATSTKSTERQVCTKWRLLKVCVSRGLALGDSGKVARDITHGTSQRIGAAAAATATTGSG
jgi:endonuclease/exonuclease/phosphatase (EEP) superfamily protein YafD